MFAHLTLFVALAAGGSAEATPPADVVVAGPVLDVAMTAGHVWALQNDVLVALSHEGQVLQRSALPAAAAPPDARTRVAEQSNRDKALFNKFGLPEAVRESVEGEDWLDDNRTRADRATAAPPTVAAGQWLLHASRDTVYLASAQGLWLLRDEDMAWRRVISLPSSLLSLAANRAGTVAMSDGRIMRVVQTNGEAPVLERCDIVQPSAWMTALVVEQTALSCAKAPPPEQKRRPSTPSPFDTELTVHSACNAGGRVFVNTSHGMFVSDAQTTAWEKVGGPAPFAEIRCNESAPDNLLAFSPRGAGAALSTDAGRHWQRLQSLEGQPANGIAATESTAWVASSFGLLAVPTRVATRVELSVPRAFLAPTPPRWRALVPQVHLSAQWQKADRSDGKQTTAAAAFLSAEFVLDGKDPTLRQAERPVAQATRQMNLSGSPPPCLARLRDSAAALAMADPERMRSMASRAANAGWLPELRFRAEKRWGRNQSLDLEDGTTFAPLGLDTVNDLRVEVRATWDLARAVYSPDELAVALGTLRVVDARQELMTLVNRLFFERRRLSAAASAAKVPAIANVESAPAPTSSLPDTDDIEPLTARISRLTADLDALTGGLAQSCW